MNFVPSGTSLVPFKGYKSSVLLNHFFEGAAFSPSGGGGRPKVTFRHWAYISVTIKTSRSFKPEKWLIHCNMKLILFHVKLLEKKMV